MAVKRNCIFVCYLSAHAVDAPIAIDYSLNILIRACFILSFLEELVLFRKGFPLLCHACRQTEEDKKIAVQPLERKAYIKLPKHSWLGNDSANINRPKKCTTSSKQSAARPKKMLLQNELASLLFILMFLLG